MANEIHFIHFLLSLFCGFLIVFPSIILSGEWIYTVISDFNVQQVPFTMLINKSIKSGNILWSWVNDLGSNFISTFSFYNLLSPFSIISYIFPANWYPYLVGPFEILKYGVSGLTSYLFLKRYVENKNYAILGSLLYSFSGFQMTNLIYHFHDIIALFPLLLYSLGKLIYDNKKVIFCLSVMVLALTNWFFFIGQAVFIAIYFIVKVLTKDYKLNWKLFFNIAVESLIGVGISAFLLLPTFIFTLSNPRISGEWTLINMFKYSNLSTYLEILRSLVSPSQLMYPRAFITSINYCGIDFYLPVVGVILVITYIFNNKNILKDWKSILAIVGIIFMFVPILNSTFVVFTSSFYGRWYYMLILIFSLMSIISLEKKYNINIGLIGTFIIFLVLTILIKYSIGFENSIFDWKYFINSIIVILISITLIIVIHTYFSKNMLIFYTIIIIIFSGAWGNYTLIRYRSSYGDDKWKLSEVKKNYFQYEEKNAGINERINGYKCLPNMGIISNNKNLLSFNSNISGESFKFYKSIGINRTVSTSIKYDNKDLNNFLSVKYLIDCSDNNKQNVEKYGYKYVKKVNNYKVYKNYEFKRYGFSVNQYISKKEFKKLSDSKKFEILNTHVVLSEKQINKFKKLYDDNKSVQYSKYSFDIFNSGFSSNIKSSNETLAIYTIPYDNGWNASINGKKVKIENIDNGLMAIKINKGTNKIVFNYEPQGLKLGIIISIISCICLYIYVYKFKREEKLT